MDNMDIGMITIFDKSPCIKKGSKYIVGYINSEKITPLCILRSKMSGLLKIFDDVKTMSFLIKNGNY